MYRYGGIKITDIKENQKRFNEVLDTTMPIDKVFERIYDWIQYADDGKHQYTPSQIINNYYNVVLSMGLYTEPINTWRKNLSSVKTWSDFKKFFMDEYHNLSKLKLINATQKGFHLANMAITV